MKNKKLTHAIYSQASLFFFIILVCVPGTTREIIKEIGLAESTYELKSGPPECLFGFLRWVGESDNLALQLGNHILIEGIGRKPYKEKDNECEWEIKTTHSAGKVESNKIIECKGLDKATYKTTLSSKDKKLIYQQEIITKKIKRFTCVLERK